VGSNPTPAAWKQATLVAPRCGLGGNGLGDRDWQSVEVHRGLRQCAGFTRDWRITGAPTSACQSGSTLDVHLTGFTGRVLPQERRGPPANALRGPRPFRAIPACRVRRTVADLGAPGLVLTRKDRSPITPDSEGREFAAFYGNALTPKRVGYGLPDPRRSLLGDGGRRLIAGAGVAGGSWNSAAPLLSSGLVGVASSQVRCHENNRDDKCDDCGERDV
jgi:hypothetical protein